MKILFVLENYLPNIGGVETVFKNLTENLAKLGHNISIITHRLKGTKKFEIINKVKIYRISCLYSRYIFSFLAIPKTISMAKDYDLIHTTTYNGSLPARIASKLAKKPSVITVHEILGKKWEYCNMGPLNAKLHQLLEKVIIKLNFDCFIAVSKSTKKELIEAGVKENKIKVAYNGVDYNLFNPKKYDSKKIRKKLKIEKDFVYMGYGRPGITKGIEYLIKAVPIISKIIPDSKLLLILSKSPKNRYNYILKLISKPNIKDKIILLEPIKGYELPAYIKAADCVVVPSLTEGFGFTTAEACAMQKPVIATNTTSLPEIVSGRYVLIKPKNPEDIAKGVELVYKKKDNYKKLKRFTIKNNINNYMKIYKELIK